jgi:hypothetical protein
MSGFICVYPLHIKIHGLKCSLELAKKLELPHIYFPNCNGPFHNHSWTLKIHYYIIPIQLITLKIQIEYHQRYTRKILLKNNPKHVSNLCSWSKSSRKGNIVIFFKLILNSMIRNIKIDFFYIIKISKFIQPNKFTH